MTDEHRIDAPDADDQLDPGEQALAETIAAGRPIPTASFRGALARHLAALDPGYGPRPARLRLTLAGLAASGLLLMLAGALQATGAL